MTRRHDYDPTENWAKDRSSDEHRRHDGGLGWMPDRHGHNVRESFVAGSEVTKEAADIGRTNRQTDEKGNRLSPRTMSPQSTPFSNAARRFEDTDRWPGTIKPQQPR